ncbi:hypothetical protein B0H14DRAFT_3490890 [Mycena olivaceomarginata]|nr:hypothetical protein B0H14DRAFT_3490890 [Mycena olivaceomarginata]
MANSNADETTPVLAVLDLPADDNDDDWVDEDTRLQGLGTTTHRSPLDQTRRKVSLYNAKISALMARLNEDRDVGRRYTMPDIKRMVKEDPSMLEGFSKEEEGSMLDDIRDKRDRKHRGARANNLAASADAKRTVERLMEEVRAFSSTFETREPIRSFFADDGLAERSGMIGFAMFTRGHIHDTSIPVTLESWGALSFFREVLKRDPADVSALFELWGDTGAETLLSMQKECTEMIKTGLQTIAGRTKIAMNYDNYIKAIRMSKQSAIGPLRTLRDALKAGTCRWAVLSASQKKKLLADFQVMVDEGKATQKAAKPRGKGNQKQVGEPRETSTRTGKKQDRRTTVDDNDDQGLAEENEGDASEGEEGPRRKPSAVTAQEAQRQRLLALWVARTRRLGGKRKRDMEVDGAPAAKAKSRKRKRLDDDSDDDDAPPRRRRRPSSEEAEDLGAFKTHVERAGARCSKAEAKALVQGVRVAHNASLRIPLAQHTSVSHWIPLAPLPLDAPPASTSHAASPP